MLFFPGILLLRKNIFHFHFHLGCRAPPVGPLTAVRLTEVDHVTGQREVRVVGLRVASQQVGAGLVLTVAPHNAEIIHQPRTQAGALHADDLILTYRSDEHLVSGYIRTGCHISKTSNTDKMTTTT